MAVYKNLAVIGWQCLRKKLRSRYCYWSYNLRFFTNHIFSTLHHQICCTEKYLIFPKKVKISVLSIQGSLHSNKMTQQIFKEALSQNHLTFCWMLTSTHIHHIVSIQYPSHKCLAEKSCLDCFRILIISWLFKDQVVIIK